MDGNAIAEIVLYLIRVALGSLLAAHLSDFGSRIGSSFRSTFLSDGQF
jgi:hypothetical protein